MLRGESLAHVTAYRDPDQMWRGMARISAGALRWSGGGGLITALFITAVMTPLLVVAVIAGGELNRRWLVAGWGSTVAGLWPWSPDASPRWRLLLAPAGALFVQLAALWGLLSRLSGRGLHWKGRLV